MKLNRRAFTAAILSLLPAGLIASPLEQPREQLDDQGRAVVRLRKGQHVEHLIIAMPTLLICERGSTVGSMTLHADCYIEGEVTLQGVYSRSANSFGVITGVTF